MVGICQQLRGDAVIHKEWWPALQSGLHQAGGELTDPAELTCPFHSHLFQCQGTLGAGDTYQPGDLEGDKTAQLEQLWQSAAQTEPERVPSPQEVAAGDSLTRTPLFVQRALNALSKSKFCADLSQNLMTGDLMQVLTYLRNPEVHEGAIRTVLDRLTDGTRLVVGHSLGSVVKNEALCRQLTNLVSFVMVGSPLGIRYVIFDITREAGEVIRAALWAAESSLPPARGSTTTWPKTCNGPRRICWPSVPFAGR